MEYKKIIDFGDDAVEATFNIERSIENLMLNAVSEYVKKNNEEKSFGMEMLDAIYAELHKRNEGGEIVKDYAEFVQKAER